MNYNDGWTCNSNTYIFFIYHLSERIYWEDIIINKIMSKYLKCKWVFGFISDLYIGNNL